MLAIDAPAAPTQHTDLVDRPCFPAFIRSPAAACLRGLAKTIGAKLTQRQLRIGGGGWLTGDKNTIKRLNQAVLNRRTSWPNTMRFNWIWALFCAAQLRQKEARRERRLDRWTEGSYPSGAALAHSGVTNKLTYISTFFLSRPRQRRKFHYRHDGLTCCTLPVVLNAKIKFDLFITSKDMLAIRILHQ